MFGNLGVFGINFNKMNLSSEPINKLLEDPNTNVEDLLKEEELLQELRSQNEKLIDYFDKDKIKRLLDYIIKEQEDEQNKGYKFPFLCSQIFGLEIDKIMKHFFITNKQLQEEEENKKKEQEKENEKEKENNENKEPENEENKDDNENKKEEEKVENKENKENEENKKEEENKENKKEEEVKDAPKEENKEEPKNEEVKENKEEEPKKEEVQKEEPKKEEEQKENKEEPKKEEAQKEEPKKEEVKEEQNKDEEKKNEEKDGEEEKKEDEENKEDGEENREDDDDNKSEPESTENRMELLDYFFKFLEEDEDKKLNYVLCGYFSSLVINLLTVNPEAFLKYVYTERKDVLDKMVTHCYRKSISDTLSKLLHFENYLQNAPPLDEETKKDMEDTRNYLFTDIFQKIDIDMDNEDLNSIYFLITGLFDTTNINEEKDIFKVIIENRPIMKALITKPFFNLDLISFTPDNYEKIANRRRNFGIIIDLILFFLTNIKKLKLEMPTSISDSKLTITHTKLSDEIFNNLGNLIKNNFNKKNDEEKPILQSFNESMLKPLGEYKIKIVDLLCNLVPYFKNISKFYDEILIESEFFKNAFDYLIQYEWNNIYQESLLSLLDSLLNEANDHQLIQEHLFNTLNLFELIKKHTNKEEKIKLSEEASTISHGYYSFFISLSYKINTVIGGKPIVVDDKPLKQGSFAFIAKVPEEGDKKAAANLLYGGDELDNNENNEEKEEKKCNYDLMQKYLNDDWCEYFGLNIEDVIKQYENKDWPEQEKKKDEDMPFAKASEDNNHEDMDEQGESKRDRNIFNLDEDYDDEDKNEEDNERAGVRDNALNNVNVDDFDFEDKDENKEKEKENKEDDNPFKNNDIKENEFEFNEQNEENKEKKDEEKNEEKNEENKNEDKKEEPVEKEQKEPLEEPKKEEPKVDEGKKEENVEEPKKEEAKVEEEKKEEKVEEPKKEEPKVEVEKKEEEKKEEKTEEPKKEEEKKEEKLDEVKKEEEKTEIKKENETDDKKEDKK